jgi:hypothetical protein
MALLTVVNSCLCVTLINVVDVELDESLWRGTNFWRAEGQGSYRYRHTPELELTTGSKGGRASPTQAPCTSEAENKVLFQVDLTFFLY